MARRILPQCWAQCDYLSFSLAGHSFRGHHRLKHTHRVRLCHFSDSITSGALHQYCSVTQQRPMRWVQAPALWIRTHSNGSQYHCRPCSLTRRWCYWDVEKYYFLTPRFVDTSSKTLFFFFTVSVDLVAQSERERFTIRWYCLRECIRFWRLVISCSVGSLWGMNGLCILPTSTIIKLDAYSCTFLMCYYTLSHAVHTTAL